uniref:PLAT domain-containing protein n=1 Tax=Petromyzon marinus TaxID=7757 RepID=S4RSQ9_PETMA
WKILLVTGDGPDSGTEATVSLVVYGERGVSRTLLLGSGESHLFKPRSVDSFRISLPELGELYKLRVGHSGVGEASAWLLERVRLKPAGGRPLELPVTRWLADDRDDGDTWREVPVPRPGKRLLPGVVVYQLSVLTGGRAGADTDARVHASLWGERGDSGARLLHRSLNNPIPFQEGQMDVFRLEAVSLGELRKVVIGHDGTSPGQGWFLDRVVVKVTGSELDREYVFPCERWLDQGRDDRKVERELEAQVGNVTLLLHRYVVSVHVGERWGAETFAGVYMTLYGESGDTGCRKLLRSLQPGLKFQRGRTDSFLVEAVSLGQVRKVVIGHDGEGYGSGLFVKMVTVRESNSAARESLFPCWAWLDDHMGERRTVRKLH